MLQSDILHHINLMLFILGMARGMPFTNSSATRLESAHEADHHLNLIESGNLKFQPPSSSATIESAHATNSTMQDLPPPPPPSSSLIAPSLPFNPTLTSLTKTLKAAHQQNINTTSSTTMHQGSTMLGILGGTAAASAPLKPGKTNAPMLNYIYDAHLSSSKHYSPIDLRYGPQFDDKIKGNITNVTVQEGSTAVLNCRISLLQDKTVSWLRRYADDNLQLLTFGTHTYAGGGDVQRYIVELQYPNNWKLNIHDVNKKDEGFYECQISTHPPKVIQMFLKVNAPTVTIIDEYGSPLYDKYYEIDSTIQLTCEVRYTSMTSSVVYWYHGNRTLNYDTTRGGISVKTDLMEYGANSVLSIAKVKRADSGNYTCSIGELKNFTTNVQVLNESLAELYHGDGRSQTIPPTQHLYFLQLLTLVLGFNYFVLSIR